MKSMVSLGAVWLAFAGGAAAQCGQFTDEFGLPNVIPNGQALAVFDEGSGDRLFIGGAFQDFGEFAIDGVGRWDGAQLTPVGAGIVGTVRALLEFDDGSGPALYATGSFSQAGGAPASNIARWNGTAWSTLGSGLNGGGYCLNVWNDGGGDALFVGGTFTFAGGQQAYRLAKWDGATWTPFTSGFINGSVLDMEVFDDGGGPRLYICGGFDSINGVSASRIARWDGVQFTALTNAAINGDIKTLLVHDDGGGPALYAGGDFTSIGTFGMGCVSRWRNSSWSSVGGGFTMTAGSGPWASVNNLRAWDDGSGLRVYATGVFDKAGGAPVNCAARWNGATWSALAGGVTTQALATAIFDDGGGESLVVTGQIASVNGLSAAGAAAWRNGAWSSFGVGQGLNDDVALLTAGEDGAGAALFASGYFTGGAGVSGANLIARWDGSSWSTLGSGVDGLVTSMLCYDDGSGPALWVGGSFTHAGGVNAQRFARWDGASWSEPRPFNSQVRAMAAFDADGPGPIPTKLIVGGGFLYSGTNLRGVAQWDGSSWLPLNQGIVGSVSQLATADFGAGPRLFAIGSFTVAGVVPAEKIASWDGAHWAALGSGIQFGTAYASTVFDDGSGLALYIGGSLTVVGGAPVQHIARWNGSTWSSVGVGLPDTVESLQVFDAGDGPALYAGGRFNVAQGAPADYLARWNGSAWEAAPGGLVDNRVYAMTRFAAPGAFNESLFIGGRFLNAGGAPALHIARLEPCPFQTYCDAKVNSLGCTPAIGAVGAPSATSASGFEVIATNVINNKPGLLVYGFSGRAAIPFHGGVLCVAAPRFRSSVIDSGGDSGTTNCSGVYAIDVNAFAAGALGGAPQPALSTPGAIVRCQYWGRDPGFAAPDGHTLSDALEYRVGP